MLTVKMPSCFQQRVERRNHFSILQSALSLRRPASGGLVNQSLTYLQAGKHSAPAPTGHPTLLKGKKKTEKHL